MKKYVISLIFLLILSMFSGCDYYDDVDINIKQLRQHPNPFWVRVFTPLHC